MAYARQIHFRLRDGGCRAVKLLIDLKMLRKNQPKDH